MRGRLTTLAVAAAALLAAVPAGDAALAFDITLEAPRVVAAGGPASIVARLSTGAPPSGAVVEFLEDGEPLGYTIGCCNGTTRTSVTHAARGTHTFTARLAGSTSAPLDVSWAVPPGPPGQPWLTPRQSEARFRVEWAPPADDGGAPMTRTYVYQAPGPAGPWTRISEGFDRLAVTPDLAWNSTYAFAASEGNLAGEGERSAPVLVTTPVARPPGAPANVTLALEGETDVLVRWDPPADRGNGRILGYFVEHREDGGPWTRNSILAGDPRALVVSAWWDRTVDVRVYANTTAGLGAASEIASFEVPPKDGTRVYIGTVDLCADDEGRLCQRVHEGEAVTVHPDLRTLFAFTFGDVYRNGAPAAGAHVQLTAWAEHLEVCVPEEPCPPSPTRDTNQGAFTTGSGGSWSSWEIFTLPRTVGECHTIVVRAEAAADGRVGTDDWDFVLCHAP